MPEASAARDRLDSWKEIAAYIGRDIRTAMRWEKERGLPVHRVPGDGARQPVFAYKLELDKWLKQREGRAAPAEQQIKSADLTLSERSVGAADGKIEDHPTRKRVRPLAAIALALTMVVGIVIIIRHRPALSDPALTVRIRFATMAIRAYDDAGRVTWIHQFAKPIHPDVLRHAELTENLVRIADFHGDGRREVLVTVPLEQSTDPRVMGLTEIDCFS